MTESINSHQNDVKLGNKFGFDRKEHEGGEDQFSLVLILIDRSLKKTF